MTATTATRQAHTLLCLLYSICSDLEKATHQSAHARCSACKPLLCRFRVTYCKQMAQSTHLNSGLIVSGFISSTILSRVGIQLGARWQFCNTTQQPEACASAMSAAALGPWPWPKEMADSLLAMPLSAAAQQQRKCIRTSTPDRLAGMAAVQAYGVVSKRLFKHIVAGSAHQPHQSQQHPAAAESAAANNTKPGLEHKPCQGVCWWCEVHLQTVTAQTWGHCLVTAQTPAESWRCCRRNMLPGLWLTSL